MRRRTFLALLPLPGLSGCSGLLDRDESNHLTVYNRTEFEIQFDITIDWEGQAVFESSDTLPSRDMAKYSGIVEETGMYTLRIELSDGRSGEDSWVVSDPFRWQRNKAELVFVEPDDIWFDEEE